MPDSSSSTSSLSSTARRAARSLSRRSRAAGHAFVRPQPPAKAPHAGKVKAQQAVAAKKADAAKKAAAAKAASAKKAAPKLQPRTLPEVTPTSPPGTRVTAGFFDAYPRFFETSNTTPFPWRLNLRYDAIFGQNKDVFEGARVLDIASHDGRWSLAALQTGAESVIGIEGRPELVANAEQNLEHYGIDRSRYRFVAGDIYEVLANEDIKVDVVLCLGFMYHTLRYNELLHRIAQCSPRFVIVDTNAAAIPGGALVRVRTEAAQRERNAIADDFSFGADVLTGYPSAAALELMLGAYGFDLQRWSDWGGLLRDNPGWDNCNDYRLQRRITARAEARRT